MIDAYQCELLESLIDNGVSTQEQLDLGFMKAKKRSASNSFLMTAEEFAMSCNIQPEDLSLPSASEAYRLACIEAGKYKDFRVWPHEVIRKTVQDVKISNLKLEDGHEKFVQKEFESKYREICARYAKGERFTIPEERRIERQETPPLPKAESAQRMGGLLSSYWG